MGFLKDIRNLQEQAEAMRSPDHRGIAGGLRDYLIANGRQGSATIRAVRETGLSIDDDPTVELDLAVSVEGVPTYAVTHQQTISRIAVPSLQPGATVPVRIDPVDPQSLMIA